MSKLRLSGSLTRKAISIWWNEIEAPVRSDRADGRSDSNFVYPGAVP